VSAYLFQCQSDGDAAGDVRPTKEAPSVQNNMQ
jgi:hypothetical protein